MSTTAEGCGYWQELQTVFCSVILHRRLNCRVVATFTKSLQSPSYTTSITLDYIEVHPTAIGEP